MRKHHLNIQDNTTGDKVFRLVAYLLLAAIMIALLYPLWVILVASFSDPKELYTKTFIVWPTTWTLESFDLVFRNQAFLQGIWNSVAYTTVGTLVNIIMNIAGAYPLSKKRLKGRSVITFLFTFTMFFSGGIVPIYLLINSLGLLNNFWVMILPSAVGMFNIIIMRTYFQTSIPQEMEDAASVDGCTNFSFLLRIVLPLSGPIIAVVALYYGVARWNDYFTALMYLTQSSKYPLQLVLRDILIQNQVGQMLNVATDAGYADRMISRMGLKYAVIVISTIPILMVYPFVQRFFSKGVMIGAIKG